MLNIKYTSLKRKGKELIMQHRKSQIDAPRFVDMPLVQHSSTLLSFYWLERRSKRLTIAPVYSCNPNGHLGCKSIHHTSCYCVRVGDGSSVVGSYPCGGSNHYPRNTMFSRHCKAHAPNGQSSSIVFKDIFQMPTFPMVPIQQSKTRASDKRRICKGTRLAKDLAPRYTFVSESRSNEVGPKLIRVSCNV
ncbi:hypothetical protein GGP41_004587 [Bipolaris sorokiniana]|uniref:Uncharacterized protein n=1 Tax=Cochliobolus sativus TaxID=45130 RepID=A0A8H5ZE38_COCSA|nr:hypothetical protein GGP41_004587 [Bipolaris sorokiniana]